ncbi:hypothetical protein [Roseateles flavus]|uniref:UrcA family protein n=1 Tax=Roseateles flavus TaxID=3149041 RepID=A0ABV0GKK1_9BURK
MTAILSALMALGALLASSPAQAQTSPARGAITTEADLPMADIPMANLLALLQQIAPAASEGAKVYLGAFRLQCGRALSTAELRHALARDGGDPVLMGLIRSCQQQDLGARNQGVQELVRRIRCPAGGLR